MNTRPFWLNAVFASLTLTIFIGVIMRLMIAASISTHFDLRQAHSHLAFYGVIVPVSFVFSIKSAESGWFLGRNLTLIYLISLLFSVLSFFYSGYNFFSYLFSTLIFGLWVVFAIKNFCWVRLKRFSFLSMIPMAIIISSFHLIHVISLSVKKAPHDVVFSGVRGFLSTLILMVFLPSVFSFHRIQASSWVLYIYFFSGLLFTASIASPGLLLGLEYAPLVFCAVLIYVGIRSLKSMSYYILAFALGMTFFQLGYFKAGSNIMIAGFHFIVISCLFYSFSVFRSLFSRVLQDSVLLVFVLLIFLMSDFTQHYVVMNLLSALSGVYFLIRSMKLFTDNRLFVQQLNRFVKV